MSPRARSAVTAAQSLIWNSASGPADAEVVDMALGRTHPQAAGLDPLAAGEEVAGDAAGQDCLHRVISSVGGRGRGRNGAPLSRRRSACQWMRATARRPAKGKRTAARSTRAGGQGQARACERRDEPLAVVRMGDTDGDGVVANVEAEGVAAGDRLEGRDVEDLAGGRRTSPGPIGARSGRAQR